MIRHTEMKHVTLVFVVIVLLVGVTLADDPIPSTPETQQITTRTAVEAFGSMSEIDRVVWTMSNKELGDDPSLDGWFDESFFEKWVFPHSVIINQWEKDSTPEKQAVMSYTENTLAQNGRMDYDALTRLNTADQLTNQDNFETGTQLDFATFPDTSGRVTTTECLLLDSASQGSNATGNFLCPFTHPDDDLIPSSCNVVEMGSSFAGKDVSMFMFASERHVARTSDIPVEMEYEINLAGSGSAEAYIDAHLMEGRSAGWVDYSNVFVEIWTQPSIIHVKDYHKMYVDLPQAADISYSEKTTASGNIESFSKSMSYSSRISDTGTGIRNVRQISERDVIIHS